MGRVAAILILLFSFASAKWCIYHAAQKRIYDHEDKIFYKNFPDGVILKERGLYRFVSGPYQTKSQALQTLSLAKKFHPDAYIKPCKSLKKRAPKQEIKKVQPQKKTPETAQPQTAKNRNPKEQLSKDSFVKSILQKMEHKKDNYYTLSFEEFLHRLLGYEYEAKNIDYQRKLEELEAKLEQNGYDWDIFAYAVAGYSKFIDYDLVTNKEFTLDGGIGIGKRLFDGGYGLKDRIARLKKRLATVRSIQAKDKLSLYALQIYMEAYANERIKEIYQNLYFNQKAFFALIKERLKVGLAGKVDYLDAKNDMLTIKRAFLAKIYDAMYSDYLIRNAIGLDTKKPIRLQEFGVMAKEGDLQALYQKAMQENPDITVQRYLFELQKEYLKKAQNARYPILDLSSQIFYEYKKDFGVTPHQSTNGLNYNVNLNMKIPLYGPEASSEAVQKEKIKTLMQKNDLLKTIKENARQIHRYYNEIDRIERTLQIVQEQLTLTKEKIDLIKKRYQSGLSGYRRYSDALRELLRLSEERYMLQAARVSDEGTLSVLQGKHLFYGED